MGLEATVVCVDNSEWMRNGDFVPTRMQAQQDAVNVVCRMKTRQNAENTVGLLSLSDAQVHVTLTSDQNKIFKALQPLEPKGSVNFVTSLRIAHLALKHRQNKNQKMKVVAFIGSPLTVSDKELTKLAKRLKKEKVTIDIVSFGETEENAEKLKKFIETLNGKDRTSHLVTAHPGPLLSDILLSSPIFTDEEGAPLVPLGQGFEFGIDPTEDPELAMALRVSMEEQRQRQEEEVRRATQQSNEQGPPPTITEDSGVVVSQEGGGILAQAQTAELPYNPVSHYNTTLPSVNIQLSSLQAFAGMATSELTEEQELALALQMSLQGAGMSGLLEQAMETETTPTVATDGGEPTGTTEVPEDSDSKYRLSYHIPLNSRQETLQLICHWSGDGGADAEQGVPGVCSEHSARGEPEQALRNLREMTEASTSSSAQAQGGGGGGGEGKEEEAMELEKTESKTKDQ
ncbi:26S proteasome non-ATPase regulatory subunit 4 [Geodia barretti]|uniref:26S proteasome non-ATPase regulatory subunit 4 n=2 Tax=Geodia barretti TaxID=519541 RepID=A0AA35XFP5_GEOBA|nr:26S proteasome non-ATPase regulatory subunit 4 [Geodia barretti]